MASTHLVLLALLATLGAAYCQSTASQAPTAPTLYITNGTSAVTGRGFVCRNLCTLHGCHCLDCDVTRCVFIPQQWQCGVDCKCTCYHETPDGK